VEYWDDLYPRTTPKLADGPQRRFFTERREQMLILDEKTIRYIKTKAKATRQTPAELVADFVRKDFAAAQ
jgi:hypothetical protein